MNTLVATALKRFKNFFSNDINKPVVDIEKSLDWYEEEKEIVKSLFNQEIIELDEYREKINLLDKRIQELKDTSITVVNNYADAIIKDEKGNTLFLRRNSNDTLFADCWGLPGGKIDEGETPEEAVKREVQEETGMVVSECYLVAKKVLPNGGTIHYFKCFVKNINDQIILDNEEHFSYEYVSEENYSKYTFIPGLKDSLDKIIEFYQPKEDIVKLDPEISKAKDYKELLQRLRKRRDPEGIEKESKVGDVEFITEDRDVKYTKIKDLTDQKQVPENFFFEYIQTVSSFPDPDFKPVGKFDDTNQTALSDKSKKDLEIERAQKADLITLPPTISGTNCSNCKFIDTETHDCLNKEVLQKVSENMCCIFWDAPGTNRDCQVK